MFKKEHIIEVENKNVISVLDYFNMNRMMYNFFDLKANKESSLFVIKCADAFIHDFEDAFSDVAGIYIRK